MTILLAIVHGDCAWLLMDKLSRVIRDLSRSPIGRTVARRLVEFSEFANRGPEDWFSELCFCILTANSKGRTAYNIQMEIGPDGFCRSRPSDIRACIMRHKHRFHNNKTDYIVCARKYLDIKERITGLVRDEGQLPAREWLVKNIKGLGYKEASHFLRNIGYFNVAIIDRHVLNVLSEHCLVTKPKTINRKSYLEIEDVLRSLARELKMSIGELDLYLWYMKAGEVLK
ncbi:MAG: N-glycosylase/DNA lyase [Candidatus Woesearchaeota archaeon]